jgi:hypothetical protein
MHKSSLYSAVVFGVGLLCIEFLVVPYTFFAVLPLMNDAGYIAGLAALSLPRVLSVVLLVLLISRLGRVQLGLAAGIYICVLVLKFVTSEVYIQPKNLYATATAIAPYVAGLLALLIAGWLLWPGKSGTVGATRTTS